MPFENWSLDKLIHPVTTEEFLAEYWEQKPLIVNREQPRYYDSLLTLEGVNRVIESLDHYHPTLTMANATRDASSKDFTYPSGLIDVARLYAAFADGSTIALNHLHDRLPSLGFLCRAMEAETSSRFQTNIYFTPPNGQGFKSHYDSHCVFAMQVHGRKHWRIYDTPLPLPHHGQGFVEGEVEIGPVSAEFDLMPGDFVYCPRGVAHDANTIESDECSVHITLGALEKTWTDFLLEAIAKLSVDDPRLRRGLPLGFARHGYDRTDARAFFADLADYALKNLDFDATFDFFVDDVVSTRHAMLEGQFEQVMRLEQVTPETRAGRRPYLLFKRSRDPEQRLLLECYGNRITFPAHAGEAVEHALDHDEYAVADLPGDLDDAGKVVLVRRLVREGLVRLL